MAKEETKKPQLEEMLGIREGEKFVPTQDQWLTLMGAWHKEICGVLWSTGPKAMVEDAVSEAFLKVSGLSDRYKLEKPIQKPISLKALRNFVIKQAKWMMGHERERAHRWQTCFGSSEELARNNANRKCGLEAFDDDTETHDRKLEEVVVDFEGREAELPVPGDNYDEAHLTDRVRRLVEDYCVSHKVNPRAAKAYVKYALDEEDIRDVVADVWGAVSDEAELARRIGYVYVRCHRITNGLLQWARQFKKDGGTYVTFLNVA